jgi:hypothetical protein
MPKFIIEREIPGAGKLSDRDLKALSQKSCKVIKQLESQVQWVQSYVSADHIHCIYIAADEALLREHARLGGFPANRILQITSIIDPTTAE